MSAETRRELILEILKRLGLYVVIGSLVPLTFCGGGCFETWQDSLETMLFGTMACIVLWEGNGRLTSWLDTRISWLEKPVQRVTWGVIITIVYTVIAVVGISYVFMYIISGTIRWDAPWLYGTAITSTLVTAIITLFLHSRTFFLLWKEEALKAEQLKREQINSQYLTLKNQLQPHFLFNSLSALTTLVHQDPNQATAFIQELSGMYRYILEYAQEREVPLDKEMAFLKSYLFLMNIRFGENLHTEFDVPQGSQWKVAPLTLQLLAENALKHNEVSRAKPLTLRISVDEATQTLTMENPLQLRAIPRDSTGVGLKNIRERYRMIANREVEIRQTEDSFAVTVPLILRQPNQPVTNVFHEGSDH